MSTKKPLQTLSSKSAGVYCIKNLINGNLYIGSTKSFKGRSYLHIYDLKNNKHKNPHLQNAFNKFGEESFEFFILEEVESLDNLIKIEQKYLDTLNPSYNICKKAYSRLGAKCSEESKNKMRKPKSEKHKLKLSQYRTGKTIDEMYGVDDAEATKIKLREDRVKRQKYNVVKLNKQLQVLGTYPSVKQALDSVNTQKNTSQIANAIRFNKTFRGFYWKYELKNNN